MRFFTDMGSDEPIGRAVRRVAPNDDLEELAGAGVRDSSPSGSVGAGLSDRPQGPDPVAVPGSLSARALISLSCWVTEALRFAASTNSRHFSSSWA